MTSLTAETLNALHTMWAGRMGVSPSTFKGEQIVVRSWPGASAAVVVRCGAAVVVGAPQRALDLLRELPREQLLDPDSLMATLGDHDPQLLGPAQLAYADAQTLTLPSTSQVRSASRRDLDSVLAACPDADREESGLEEMEQWWVASDRHGAPVAAAGYETWDGIVAHLGVLVAPSCRGRGHGAGAASAAVEHAVRAGLVPQWRSAAGNEPSRRLGRSLGFQPLGEQITLLLSR